AKTRAALQRTLDAQRIIHNWVRSHWGLGKHTTPAMAMGLCSRPLSTQEISFQQLLAEAPTPSGIYRDHLQEYHTKLLKYPELSSAFNEVVAADSPVQISSLAAYKLESMGLIRLSGNKVIPSCQLYRIYFRDYIAA
ncbi:MAG: AAA-like domain-containing protein, partial [Cyanobacteria bacterium J06638_38]